MTKPTEPITRERAMELAAHPEQVTTRAEAEAVVRSTGRTCKGVPRDAERTAARALLAEGRHEEASAMDDASYRHPAGHPNAGQYACGHNINDLIVAGPFDGQSHEVTCPTCGRTMRYTAPYFTKATVQPNG